MNHHHHTPTPTISQTTQFLKLSNTSMCPFSVLCQRYSSHIFCIIFSFLCPFNMKQFVLTENPQYGHLFYFRLNKACHSNVSKEKWLSKHIYLCKYRIRHEEQVNFFKITRHFLTTHKHMQFYYNCPHNVSSVHPKGSISLLKS